MVKNPKVPVFLSQSTQVAYSFTVFLKSTLYLLMKNAVVWNLRGYEGNCKHHKSRSTVRCLNITSCNNHKAFKRSQDNVTKPMRIHKHFTPPASYCLQGASQHPLKPLLGSSTKLVAPGHMAPIVGQAPQLPEHGTDPPGPLGLEFYWALLPRKGSTSRKTNLDYLWHIHPGLSSLCLHIAVYLICAVLAIHNQQLKSVLVSSISRKPSATLTLD